MTGMWQIIVLKDLISFGVLRETLELLSEIFLGGKNTGRVAIVPHWNLFPSHSIQIVNFWGEALYPHIPTCSFYRHNMFLTFFHNNIYTCLVLTLLVELEFTIYYLSIDSYVVSSHFLHADYGHPCLITWWNFFFYQTIVQF